MLRIVFKKSLTKKHLKSLLLQSLLKMTNILLFTFIIALSGIIMLGTKLEKEDSVSKASVVHAKSERTVYQSNNGDTPALAIIDYSLQTNPNEIRVNEEVGINVSVKNLGNVTIRDFTLYFESDTMEFIGVDYQGGVEVPYDIYTNKVILPNLPPKESPEYGGGMLRPGEWNPFDGVLSAARNGGVGETMTLSFRLKVKSVNSRSCVRTYEKVLYVSGGTYREGNITAEQKCLDINVRQSRPNP